MTTAGTAPTPTVRLGANASRLARKGRPWFFLDDLEGPLPAKDPDLAPPLVRVVDPDGRDLGLGLFAPGARLALRLAGPWPGYRGRDSAPAVPEPEEFFAVRLQGAVARRAALRGPRAGVRLVHGESDELPGLVVDQYAGGLVVQVTAQAVERLRSAWVPELVRLLEPGFVVSRNDTPTRKLERLPTGDGPGSLAAVELLHGRRTEVVEIEEGGLTHRVRPWEGHKTGFYLDQRPARALVRDLAGLGRGRHVLDLFSYQGGFGLSALRGGAEQVVLVDESAPALESACEGALRNRLLPGPEAVRRGPLEAGEVGAPGAGKILRATEANVFDELRRLRGIGATFDLVVCDPPAFARSRREVRGALRGYRDLNRLALRLLEPGGLLLTCSCSHHVGWRDFEDVVRQAAGDLPFPVLLRRRIGAGDDHPVRLGVPESEYLKVLLLEVPWRPGETGAGSPSLDLP